MENDAHNFGIMWVCACRMYGCIARYIHYVLYSTKFITVGNMCIILLSNVLTVHNTGISLLLSTPGAPLTYFTDGGRVPRVFLGLKFWPKGIFWVYEKTRDFFRSREKKGYF